MTARSVAHDTFTIERTYPASPSRLFAAFASAEAKDVWGDTGGLEPADGEAGTAEFDFRVSGRERFATNGRARPTATTTSCRTSGSSTAATMSASAMALRPVVKADGPRLRSRRVVLLLDVVVQGGGGAHVTLI
jgi:hypothetical protein